MRRNIDPSSSLRAAACSLDSPTQCLSLSGFIVEGYCTSCNPTRSDDRFRFKSTSIFSSLDGIVIDETEIYIFIYRSQTKLKVSKNVKVFDRFRSGRT